MKKKLPGTLVEIVASFPTARPLRLMFQDEARFGRISDTRYCWARRPMRPMVKAMLTHQYTYAYGAVSPLDGRFDSLILPHVNTECMQLFITEIGRRYPNDNIVMVVDGAGWHQSKDLKPPENLKLHFLPPYSPELNPQEHIWDELREKHFHNQAFDSLDALEEQLLAGLRYLEQTPAVVKSISAWEWILNSLSVVTRYVASDVLEVQRLFPMHLLAVVEKSHWLASATKAEVIDLVNEPLLLMPPDTGSRVLLEQACRQQCGSRLRDVRFEGRSYGALIEMAHAGHGIAIVLSTVFAQHPELHAVPVFHRGRELGHWAAVLWRRGSALPPHVEAFVRLSVEVCRTTKSRRP